MNKIAKRVLVACSILLVVVLAVGFAAGNYFFNLALNPRADKSKVLDAPHNEVDLGKEDPFVRYDEDKAWFTGEDYREIWAKSFDGLDLHAYLLENEDPSAGWVILSHGYNSWGLQLVSTAHLFFNRGYSILMPEARGCGSSGGDYLGMGWLDRHDLIGWVNTINEQYMPDNVVLYGVSMGGSTVMMASGEELPANVRAIVSDCGYTSVIDEFSYQLGQLFSLPSFPLLNFSSAVTRIRAGYWLEEANAVKQIEKSQTPILFIHGENDAFVPAWMVQEAYGAASCEKELLVVEGAGHGGASTTAPELYWETVDRFLGQYLV